MTRHEAYEHMLAIFSKHCNLSNEEYMAFTYEVEKLARKANEAQISMDPVIIQMKCFDSVVGFMKRSKLITEEQRGSLKLLADEIYDDAWLKLHEGKEEEDGGETDVGISGERTGHRDPEEEGPSDL